MDEEFSKHSKMETKRRKKKKIRKSCVDGTYRNDPKFSDTQKMCCNHSKVWIMWLYHRVMSPNNADGMANTVDPDQTAPLGAVCSSRSSLIWVCTVCPGLSVRKLRIITVHSRLTRYKTLPVVQCLGFIALWLNKMSQHIPVCVFSMHLLNSPIVNYRDNVVATSHDVGSLQSDLKSLTLWR